MKIQGKLGTKKIKSEKIKTFVKLLSRLDITFQDIIDEYKRICAVNGKYSGKNPV